MPQHPFTRLAIVNRGEPAMRLIHAVRELNAQRDEPIVLIALFTEAERHAMFVREADEAVCLAPRHADAPQRLPRPRARSSGRWSPPAPTRRGSAGASSPRTRPSPTSASGSGSSSSGPERRSCGSSATRSPPSGSPRSAGVPVAPWSGGPVDTVEDALRHATRIGFPLMVKATAGGGGRGIRRVDGAGRPGRRVRIAPAPRPSRPSATARVLLERMVAPARHIEVQVIADGQGAAWAVGVRDCSCQRRHQKVIEESASPALTAEQDAELRAAAAAAGAARRLPQRRHRGVPLRARDAPLLVHGGQRPPAGRAPRHRARDRARPREAAAARRRRRPPRGRAAGRPRARHRGAAERRGPGARLPAHSRPGRAAAAADRAERARRHAAWPRATRSPRSSTR